MDRPAWPACPGPPKQKSQKDDIAMTVESRDAKAVGPAGTAAANSMGQPPILTFAMEPRLTDQERNNFVRFSSQLIHVRREFLLPPVPQDGVQLCDIYYGVLKAAATEDALKQFSELISQPKIKPETLLSNGKPSTSAAAWAARMTMMMWLFGGWYGKTERSKMAEVLSLPSEPLDAVDQRMPYFKDPRFKKDYVISSRAYANGWIWRVAQAHPMGVSQFAFGSWAKEPPSLTDYGFEPIV